MIASSTNPIIVPIPIKIVGYSVLHKIIIEFNFQLCCNSFFIIINILKCKLIIVEIFIQKEFYMQHLSSDLNYINPFTIIANYFNGSQINNNDVITISKHIFGRSFDSCSRLPYHNDVWKVIFSNISFSDLLNSSCLVSVECYKLANDPDVSKIAVYRDFCFNPSLWNNFFGEGTVSNDEIKKAFDKLPKNINEILKSPCPAFAGKRIMDTHILVWIPESINGKPLTIDSFGLLLKLLPEFSTNEIGYFNIKGNVQEIRGNVIQSGWVLMTKDPIPGSWNIDFGYEQEFIEKFDIDAETGYRLPKTGEAIISIYAKYLMSGTKKRLFRNEESVQTRCQESLRDFPVMVGNFGLCGIRVSEGRIYQNCPIGFAALRKF